MAFPSMLSRSVTSRQLTTSAIALGVVGGVYYYTRASRPMLMDAAGNPPAKTLQFPRNMLFSKQLEVTSVEQVNHDTKRIKFALPGGQNEVSGVTPGAAILTQHTPAGAWFPVFRPYTPIHDLEERGVLELLVKKYPGGRASSHLHSLEPGQKLIVRGPLPGSAWKPTSDPSGRDVLLVAGGAGITPIYSLTQGILANPSDNTRIQLLWGVNGTRDIVLRDELEALQKQHPERLQIVYAVSGPEAAESAPSLGDEARWRKGYVDRPLLQEAISRCERGNWGDEQGKKVYLCGPPKMEMAMQSTLTELGVGKKELHRF